MLLYTMFFNLSQLVLKSGLLYIFSLPKTDVVDLFVTSCFNWTFSQKVDIVLDLFVLSMDPLSELISTFFSSQTTVTKPQTSFYHMFTFLEHQMQPYSGPVQWLFCEPNLKRSTIYYGPFCTACLNNGFTFWGNNVFPQRLDIVTQWTSFCYILLHFWWFNGSKNNLKIY